MNALCQADRYTAVVSELTGRAIYINDSLDQFLVSPEADFVLVKEIAMQWTTGMAKLPVVNRPPPRLRCAVSMLESCDSCEALAVAINSVLGTEFRDRFDSTSVAMSSQRHLVGLMLRLWSIGAVAWPAKNQSPFSNPALLLKNNGFAEDQRVYLSRIRSYLDRGGTDDAAIFRFILDHLLARAGVVEIGDITPKTFYLTEERTRKGKLRSVGIQGVLSVLREEYHDLGL